VPVPISTRRPTRPGHARITRRGTGRHGSSATTDRTEFVPADFLRRSAYEFPDKIAVVHGERTTTYREFEQRLNWLTSALRAAGIQPDESGPVLRAQPPGIAGDPWSPEFDADLIRLRTKKGMRIAYAKGRLRQATQAQARQKAC
jgi:hypothetical protein